MDEEREALGRDALDSLIDHAIRRLAAGDQQAKAAIHRLAEAYDAVAAESAGKLTREESCLLDSYMNALMDANNHEYRYLYVQGIKDCIGFLIKLGLLRG